MFVFVSDLTFLEQFNQNRGEDIGISICSFFLVFRDFKNLLGLEHPVVVI